MPEQDLASKIETINKTIGAIIPTIGLIGGLAAVVIRLAEKNGEDVTTFKEEIAKFNLAKTAVENEYAKFQELFPE